MSETKLINSGGRAVALKADGNPEGKGLNGFLLDWSEAKPRGIVAKAQHQLLAELFTSMLVLSAEFRYRPAVGNRNYLYWENGKWILSLVAPEEWSNTRQTRFAGTCVLQRDRTWTITPSKILAEDNAVSDAVARFYDAFADIMDTDLTLEDVLPFYAGRMPYFQRLNANALSRSMRASMQLGDQTSIRCRDWQLQLPELDRVLLTYAG